MRRQFIKTVSNIITRDKRVVLLLGDIGVWGFHEVAEKCPDRVYNIGILEQSTIGVASGLAISGFIPIVHTIAPFIVERAYEQLKLDFGYQNLGGNFISVGASYDYAALGSTHHCPADVPILLQIPGMEIVIPGTAKEFDSLFTQAYNDGRPTYYRISEGVNSFDCNVEFGKALQIKSGAKATVIAVGSLLSPVLEATEGLDVSILYYTTLAPFDIELLRENCASGKILICEPYFFGALDSLVINALTGQKLQIEHVGVPREFIRHYGKREDHDLAFGLNAECIKKKLEGLICEN